MSGFFDKLKNFIENDGVVFGGSAGAIIMGKNIESCKCEDKNDVGLVNTTGLDVLGNYSVECHYTNQSEEQNRETEKYLLNLSKDMKVIALPEEDTIYINNSGIEVFGNKPYYIFDKEVVKSIEK